MITSAQLQAQFDLAARSMEELRKLYPGCFDANGRPIVAVTPPPFVGQGDKP